MKTKPGIDQQARHVSRIRTLVMLLVLEAGVALAVHMKQIATLSNIGGSFLSCGDANHNHLEDLWANTPYPEESLVVYEHQGNNQFLRSAFPLGALVFELGDGDGDSLADLVVAPNGNDIRIMESPDPHSYPADSVWQRPIANGHYGYPKFMDLDQDGYKELAYRRFDASCAIWLFEYTGVDNHYDSAAVLAAPRGCGQFVVGDFDRDGLMDLVTVCPNGVSEGWVYVFEGTGVNNLYVLAATCTTVTTENSAIFAAHDMDKDTWPEFGIIGRLPGDTSGLVQVFEATAHAQYHVVWSQRVPYNPGPTWHGACVGDLNGDGIDEFGFTNGAGTLFLFKNVATDSYALVWQVPSGMFCKLYDINSDARAEVITDRAIYEDTSGLTQVTEPATQPKHPLLVELRCSVAGIGSHAEFSGLREYSKLILYSSSGQLVRVQAVGKSTSWIWDLTDQQGRRVPAGTYFVLIRCQGQTASTKLCVVN